jgi:DNA-nicking Smr family endonuclease
VDDDKRDSGPDEAPIEIPITGELDLHAFSPRDVAAVAADYVRACHERGLRRVRLVHGRGRGVQRSLVRRALLSLPEVVSVSDAPPASGGWGATIVELRSE